MHYLGMAAMMTPLEMRYVPAIFALSVVVAVVLAMLALWAHTGLGRTRSSRTTRAESALLRPRCRLHQSPIEKARAPGRNAGQVVRLAGYSTVIDL